MNTEEALAIAALAAGAVPVGLAWRALRNDIRAAQASLDATVAAEVRALSRESSSQQSRVVGRLPFHESFVARYPTATWQVWIDGEQISRSEANALVDWMVRSGHPAVATWNGLGDLTPHDLQAVGAVVGFLNDICQMLEDGTPGRFIYQQYHQLILMQGTLVDPVIRLRQAGGRWGVRIPSLINRAAAFHSVRPQHQGTTIKISRHLHLADLLGSPLWPCSATHVDLMIPLIGAGTAVADFGPYPDVAGRPLRPGPDLSEFKRQVERWA